jgi:hypothetical protein
VNRNWIESRTEPWLRMRFERLSNRLLAEAVVDGREDIDRLENVPLKVFRKAVARCRN